MQTNVNWDGFGWAGRLAWWLAVSVSTLVVGLVLLWLAGQGTARILEAASTGAGPAIGWGLLVFFGLPILAVLALVTLIGWGILRLVALVPILGGLAWFAAVVFGLGALAVAIWRVRAATRVAPAAA